MHLNTITKYLSILDSFDLITKEIIENKILYLDNNPHDGTIDEIIVKPKTMVHDNAPGCVKK